MSDFITILPHVIRKDLITSVTLTHGPNNLIIHTKDGQSFISEWYDDRQDLEKEFNRIMEELHDTHYNNATKPKA